MPLALDRFRKLEETIDASTENACVIDGTLSVTLGVTLDSVPTYADEAAALAGGLTTGQLYKTALGSLQIKL